MTAGDPALPRRFVLLGTPQPETDHWMWFSVIRHGINEHQIVATVDTDLEDTPSFADWRSLLESGIAFDAILMGNCQPDVIGAIRELAARGMTLAIPVHQQLPRDLVAELSLYDTEEACALLPLWQYRLQPELHDLRHLIRAGRLGEILRIEMRVDGPFSRLEQWAEDPVEQVMLSDIDILRMLGGDYTQVLLTRTGVRDGRFVTQTLQLSGDGLPDGVSFRDLGGDDVPGRVRIEGVDSTAVFHMVDGRQRIDIDGEPIQAPIAAKASHQPFLDALDDVAQRKAGALRWQDVARAFEIMEAAERSLRKRRTIDLYFETASERSQFKTHMAAIGCGVILWTMFGLIGMLFAGSVLDPRDGMQREADAAGFVVTADEFHPDSDALTERGERHIAEIAKQINLTDSVIIIESVAETAKRPQLDERRIAEVGTTLSDAGGGDQEDRIVVRPLKGQWFARAMTVGWVMVFGPVGLFLLLQALLVIARPAVKESPE